VSAMPFLLHEESAEGIITRKNHNLLYINISSSSCSTEVSQKCESGCGACSGVNDSKKVTIFSPEANKYSVGKKIAFTYYHINDGLMATFAFGIPIGCALLTIITWYYISPLKVESPLALLSAGLAFCFGFFLIWLTDTLLRKKFPATIVTPPQ
jgi:hypothetical protein